MSYCQSINQFYVRIHAYNIYGIYRHSCLHLKNSIIHIFPGYQYKPKVVTLQYKKIIYELSVYIYIDKHSEGIGTCTIK